MHVLKNRLERILTVIMAARGFIRIGVHNYVGKDFLQLLPAMCDSNPVQNILDIFSYEYFVRLWIFTKNCSLENKM